MSSPTGINLRAILDYIDRYQLPHRFIGCGCGSPSYVDIGVDTWEDVDTWHTQVGGEAKADSNGRRTVKATLDGLELQVYSDEKRRVAPAEVSDAAVTG
jgi:hypothetical protein